MNNGKICIPVCAATVDEMLEQIKRAEDLADVVEIRFDCLDKIQFLKAFAFFASKSVLLFTFRPESQGGKAIDDFSGRMRFWEALAANRNLDKRKIWIDCELDLKSEISNLEFQKIISFHDFQGIPQNIENLYFEISENTSIAKIAVQADDITDTIPLWKLLERARSENKEIIPVAMGESGKWTRILGLAHGAFMTYAALDAGRETAPGQIAAKDLIEVYRVKELDEKTDVYGVIGGNTAYSMSPFIHNEAFKQTNQNAVFVPLQVRDLDAFFKRMVRRETREIELNFKGFAVTVPHKQAVIKHLDELHETARRIGAVNTVTIENGRLYGANTDAIGFIGPLKKVCGDLKNAKVAVIGAGGAARACVYALKNEGAEVTVFARDPKKAKALAEEFEADSRELTTHNPQLATHDIVVNATPLGTKGALENETPAVAEDLKNIQTAYDLVYNPTETRFLREAKNAGASAIGGLSMLIAQAAEQQKIWRNAADVPLEEMSLAALQRLK